MAGYPYYSLPPPSPPCNDTTPTLPPLPPPPPPPPACKCNRTTPTSPSPPPPSSYYSTPLASFSPPPPSTHYSPPLHSPPPPSHSPPPSPACNKTTPTLPPPSPPPPPSQHLPPSPYYSPPQPSFSPPPPSPPPPLSPPSPPPPSIAPPTDPPHKFPPPLISPSQPPPSISPPCHCVCPSPWAHPPNNYYPSIAPNYYHSIAPSPQFLSPSNGHRTVVLTTFVSLGGVFFVAFITIGLLSMAIKKKMLRTPTSGQPDSSQGQVYTLEKISASTSVAQSHVINIDPDQKIVPPDQGAGHVVKGEILQTMSTEPLSHQSVTDEMSSNADVERQTFKDITESDDPNKRLPQRKPSVTDSSQGMDLGDPEKGDDSNEEISKPLGDQTVPDNTDAPQDADKELNADEEKSDDCNRKPPDDQSAPDNATEQEPKVGDESNDSEKRLRPKKNPFNGRKGNSKGKRGKKPSGVGQAMNAAMRVFQCGQEYEDAESDDGKVQEVPQDAVDESNENEEKSDERKPKPFGDQSVTTDNADINQDEYQESSAVEGKSNDSRENFRSRMKNPSGGRKSKQGGKKPSGVDQAVNAAMRVFQCGQEYEDAESDEGKVKQVPQDAVDESSATEEKSDERKLKPFGDQSVTTDNADINQDEYQESSAVKGKSNDSRENICSRLKNPSGGRKSKQGGKKPSGVGQDVNAASSVYQYGVVESQNDDNDQREVQDAPQDAKHESNANEEESEEPNSRPLNNQTETENIDIEDVEQEPGTVEEESKDSKEQLSPGDKYPSSDRNGKQGERKFFKLGQAVNAVTHVDLDEAVQVQEDDKDEGELHEAEPQDDDEKLKSSGSNKDLFRRQLHTPARANKEPSILDEIVTTTKNDDPDMKLESPKEEDGEEKSFRGRKELPNLVTVASGDNPGEELESFGNPDDEWESLVDDKQKKLELFGRKEVSRLHKRQTGDGGRKDPAPNFGQILTSTTVSDAGVGLKSVSTHWRGQKAASNISESMVLRNDVDPSGELKSHDDDGEGDPNVTATYEGDPIADLEFHEDDEEMESECSNKGLGLLKLHARSLGETEFSTDDQSAFLTVDDDPDVLLQSHNDEHDEEPAESGKVARSGKPLSRPSTTGVGGKRRT